MTAKHFVLRSPIRGSESVGEQYVVRSIPRGSIVEVVRDRSWSGDQMQIIDVLWSGRVIGVFAGDLKTRAETTRL